MVKIINHKGDTATVTDKYYMEYIEAMAHNFTVLKELFFWETSYKVATFADLKKELIDHLNGCNTHTKMVTIMNDKMKQRVIDYLNTMQHRIEAYKKCGITLII